jgi:methionyl-tRNA formyltransferase
MSLRIVYMGTPEFAVAPLKELSLSQHEVVAVVTGPDVRAGRGRKLRPTPVRELAHELGLPVLTPDSLKSPVLLEELREFKADVFVVVAFRILPRLLYTHPRLGSINLHGSLLPLYRGAAPIQRALMDGAQESGFTVFSLTDKVDTGGMILQKKVSISTEDNFTTLAAKISELSGPALIEALDLMESDTVQFMAQDNSLATAAPKITASDCVIDWSLSANSIVNQIRGLAEIPGAYTIWRGKRLKVLAAKVCEEHRALQASEVAILAKKICIGAGDGSALEVLALQPEGKKKMNAVDIINGQFLREGEKLGEVANQI